MSDLPLPLQALLCGYVEQVRGRPKYAEGYKWCSKCGVAYRTNRRFCPICGSILRSRPRMRKYRDRYINGWIR